MCRDPGSTWRTNNNNQQIKSHPARKKVMIAMAAKKAKRTAAKTD